LAGDLGNQVEQYVVGWVGGWLGLGFKFRLNPFGNLAAE